MKAGLLLSILLHVMVILLIIFKLPYLAKERKEDNLIVTDIVHISEISNAPTKQSQKSDQKNTAKQQQKPSKESKPREAVKNRASKDKPVKTAESIPDKLAPKEEIKKSDKETKEKQKKKDDAFEKTILKSIDEAKNKVADKEKNKQVDQQFQDLEKALIGESTKPFNPNLKLSISEIDSIKSQINDKWNTTSFAGAPDVKTFRVIIKVTYDIEGNVLSVIAKEEDNKSSYYRPFVESAIRAIKLASPLKNLPKEKYITWKEIEFPFDPSGLIY